MFLSINHYIKATNKINLDLTSEEWAEEIDFAAKNNITLEEWLKKIDKIDKEIWKNWNR